MLAWSDNLCGKNVLVPLCALLVTFSLAACSSDKPNAGPSSASIAVEDKGSDEGARLLITRDSGKLPSRCGPREVGNLVLDFFEHFNRGDGNAIDRLFAPQRLTDDIAEDAQDGEIGFQWYVATVDERFDGDVGGLTFDRGKLVPYLLERHGQHERMRLLLLSIGSEDVLPEPEGSQVGGEIILSREADDLARMGVTDGIAHGKLAINCGSKTIYVWAVATEQARSKEPQLFGPTGAPCPIPPNWTRTNHLAIVCTRP